MTVLAVWVFAAKPLTAQTSNTRPVQVGDRWSYDVKDAITGDVRESITVVAIEVTDKEINTRITVRGNNRARTFIFSPDWGRIDDSVWQVQPSDIGIKTPLQIGKKWRSTATAKHLHNGKSARVTSSAEVLAEEKITTPAGTFDTFKVETKVRLVGSRDQTQLWNFKHTYWYTPAINRWVKLTRETRHEGRLRDSITEELTSYTQKP